jgi:hypothetical protein
LSCLRRFRPSQYPIDRRFTYLDFVRNLSLGPAAGGQLQYGITLPARDRLAAAILAFRFRFGDTFPLSFQHHFALELGDASQYREH